MLSFTTDRIFLHFIDQKLVESGKFLQFVCSSLWLVVTPDRGEQNFHANSHDCQQLFSIPCFIFIFSF